MPRNNASSADNQQERLAMAHWIVGFVDGEGSFLISIFRNKTTALGWQVFPEFIVTQGAKSLPVLRKMQQFFECGQVYINRRYDNHHEHIYRLCVRSLKDVREKIIPFFEEHPLRSAKQRDFKKFARVVGMMQHGVHTQQRGIERIRAITLTMNRKGMQHR